MLMVGLFEAELVQALNVDGAVFGGHSNPSLKNVVALTNGECKLTNATVTKRTTIRNAKTLVFCFITQVLL
jgi:hypothetical protein